VLPRGNVGTCTQFLLESIRDCKLPPSLIKRLKLNFHERRRRAYATMPHVYPETHSRKSLYVPSGKSDANPGSSRSGDAAKLDEIRAARQAEPEKKKKQPKKTDSPEDDSGSEGEEEEEAEEWDRHRTLHNDVSARRVIAHPDDLEFQAGTQERRYSLHNLRVNRKLSGQIFILEFRTKIVSENGKLIIVHYYCL
jgi:hypothetical protein